MLDPETLKKRLQTARIQRGIKSDKALLEEAGVYKGAFTDWFNKNPQLRKTADTKSLDKLARALGISVGHLIEQNYKEGQSNVRKTTMPPSEMEHGVPIHGHITAGPFQLADRYYGYAPGTNRDPADAFALIVHGDSMEPEYRSNETIYCNPENVRLEPDEDAAFPHVPFDMVKHLNGKDCVVYYNGEVTFKRLLVKRGKGILYTVTITPLNPDYPAIIVNYGDVFIVQGVCYRSERAR